MGSSNTLVCFFKVSAVGTVLPYMITPTLPVLLVDTGASFNVTITL